MLIPLVNASGGHAVIDADDYPLVQRYRWRLDSSGRYAVANCGKHQMRMHRLVMIVCGESEVDHRDRDGLNNRKTNLRVCSHAENMWNMKRSTRNGTGVKGVMEIGGRFVATVTARKVVRRESFDTFEQASQWVTTTRASLHGEFARHD